ncbi:MULTISPECIES: hypothetical protein [Nonomuraea]|uniref:Uncharacterized protein n=1 Tax=Nonomuraea mangrovi TaxID=2316207 RepID=A0ABW4TDY3_9ACTN
MAAHASAESPGGVGATMVVSAPAGPAMANTGLEPKPKQYRKGRNAGFADGRADCKSGRPYDLNISGSGAFYRGFRDGYNSGFHSCQRPSPSKPPTTKPPESPAPAPPTSPPASPTRS